MLQSENPSGARIGPISPILCPDVYIIYAIIIRMKICSTLKIATFFKIFTSLLILLVHDVIKSCDFMSSSEVIPLRGRVSSCQ